MFNTITPNNPRMIVAGLVASFGHLTTREIAMLGWPTSTPKTALNLAQKYCSAMAQDGLLLVRELPHVSRANAYVLTAKGARILEEELLQTWPRHGYDLDLDRANAIRPAVELAAHFAREKGFDVLGGRGLALGAFDLGALKGLDAVLVDEFQAACFGILEVSHFNKPTIARIAKYSRGTVPVLLAGNNEKVLAALAKERAKVAPQHEWMIEANCAGVLC